eukprot:TRINITY_DN44462_c0_g1_i1.p2 TRINITY_DN44462_c0_g1~~TRINITY_DN44462_c0_g1_i1.p2  ORF type:complete len:197 (-),score=56.11 TRINITY_DN44462_c0_g1_i1:233-802(-)
MARSSSRLLPASLCLTAASYLLGLPAFVPLAAPAAEPRMQMDNALTLTATAALYSSPLAAFASDESLRQRQLDLEKKAAAAESELAKLSSISPQLAQQQQMELQKRAAEAESDAAATAALQEKLGSMTAKLAELDKSLADMGVAGTGDDGIPTPVLGILMLSVIVILVIIVSGLVIARGLLDDETGGEL